MCNAHPKKTSYAVYNIWRKYCAMKRQHFCIEKCPFEDAATRENQENLSWSRAYIAKYRQRNDHGSAEKYRLIDEIIINCEIWRLIFVSSRACLPKRRAVQQRRKRERLWHIEMWSGEAIDAMAMLQRNRITIISTFSIISKRCHLRNHHRYLMCIFNAAWPSCERK